MSSEEVPYVFAAPVHCHLCGTSMEMLLAQEMYGADSWRGYAQELSLDEKEPSNSGNGLFKLVKPDLTPFTFLGQPRVVHSACWKVLMAVTGSTEFSQAWLNGLLDCMEDIAPFLPEIQFRPSPERLDEDLTQALTDEELDDIPSAVSGKPYGFDPNLPEVPGAALPSILELAKRPLASDIERYIASALKMGGSLAADENGIDDEDVQAWLMFGQRIRMSGSLLSGTNEETTTRLVNAMRNFKKGGPARFPHTANYDTVCRNVARIYTRLSSIPVEAIDDIPPLHGQRAKLQSLKSLEIAALKASPSAHLRFYNISRQHYVKRDKGGHMKMGTPYLRSLEFDGSTEVGEEDTYSVTISSDSLCGIRFVNDGIGVIAVHLKSKSGWNNGWKQDPSYELREDTVDQVDMVEWEFGAETGEILVVCDTEKQMRILQG